MVGIINMDIESILLIQYTAKKNHRAIFAEKKRVVGLGIDARDLVAEVPLFDGFHHHPGGEW